MYHSEENQVPVMKKVSAFVVAAAPSTQNPPAITDVWVEYKAGNNWIRATTIAVGAICRIVVSFHSTIASGTAWSTCITCIDTSIANSPIAKWQPWHASGLFISATISGSGYVLNKDPGSANVADNPTFIMPNRNINLRFMLWGNDNDSATDPPDISNW